MFHMEHFLQINEFSDLISQIFIRQNNGIVPRGTKKSPGLQKPGLLIA